MEHDIMEINEGNGEVVVYLKSIVPEIQGFGMMSGSISVKEFAGKRIMFSAEMRILKVKAAAGL